MKKLLIISLISLAISANAQLSWGIKVGAQQSKINEIENSSYNYELKSSTGVQFGLFILKDFKSFYLHFEPTYATNLGGVIKGHKVKGNSVSFPLMLGKKVSKLRLFTGIAPSTSYDLSIDNQNKLETMPDDGVMVSYVLGLGFHVTSYMISLRYTNIMGGKMKIDDNYYSQVGTRYFRTSQIMLCLNLSLNK